MKRYVLFSEKFDGYYHHNSNIYSWLEPGHFHSTIEKAYLYANETTAKATAFEMLKCDLLVLIIPVDVSITPEVDKSMTVEHILREQVEEAKQLKAKVDALSDDEVEEIPKDEWNAYRHARSLVEAYGDRFDG